MQQIIVDISISLMSGSSSIRAWPPMFTPGPGRTFCQLPGPYSLPFFLNDGVRGSFRILFDDAGKFLSIERL